MRWVIHLGVHKTGSTLLQENLAANADALLAQGLYAANGLWPTGVVRARWRLRHFQSPGMEDIDAEKIAGLLGRMRRKARNAGAEGVILSEENFLGVPIHRELKWGRKVASFYPLAERCLGALLHGLPPANVRLVLYTRRLDAMLRGHYTEALRHLGTTDTYEEFLARTDIETFRFDLLLARLRRVAPDVDYVVRPFESIRDGADGFVADFMRICGADPAQLSISADRVNHGFDADQAEEVRRISVQLHDDYPKPRELRRRVDEIAATPPDPARKMVIPARFAERVAAVMRDDRAVA